MKSKLVRTILLVLLFLPAVAFSQGEKIKMDFTFVIDELGNAKITYKQSATAQQWAVLEKTIGQNPSLLKRNLQHQLSAYDLYDFKFSKDAINRTFTFTFKARGVARYKGNGKWDIDIDEDFTPQKISKSDWYLTKSETQGDILYEYHFFVKLPKNVKNSEITTDEFGRKVLRYQIPVKKPVPYLLIASAVTGLIGIILIILSFFLKEKQEMG
jgi:hypothetical protein